MNKILARATLAPSTDAEVCAVIHGDGPEDVNGSPDSNRDENKAKPSDSRFEYEMVPLSQLVQPPSNTAGRHVAKLFTVGTSEARAELSDVLWNTQSSSLLSYFGSRLAASLTQDFAELACEVIRRKSFHCTQDLLTGLATAEYCRFVLGHSPLLEGSQFVEFRKMLAEICVSPSSHFSGRDWKKYNDEIVALTNFPITILRRSAGAEIDSILLNAATRGDLDQSNNRRALELLALREATNPDRRVLSGLGMSEIARATESLLRDPFNILQLFSLVDAWAAKEEELPSAGECAIRDQLVRRWVEFKESGEFIAPEASHRIFDVVRLLRHFHDPVAGLALAEAAKHPHTGLRILAKLSLEGAKPEILAELRHALHPEARSSDLLGALRVFGYRISPEVDRELLPILDEYAQGPWAVSSVDSATDPFQIAQRVVVLQGTVRRFYSERFDSAFLKPLFETIGTANNAMNNIAINTYLQVVQIGRIPSPHFYDDPSQLSSLQKTLSILGAQADSDQGSALREEVESASAQEGGSAPEDSPQASPLNQMVRGLQDLFVLQGPAAYGFELTIS